MSRPPRPPAAERAAILAEKLVSTDPADAAALAACAAKHYARTRKPRKPVTAAVAAPAPDGAEAAAARERAYLHRLPTRSFVLNAFLHAFGHSALVPTTVAIPDEHLLAPRLCEIARGFWPRMLIAGGDHEKALLIDDILRTTPTLNEEAARFLMRRDARDDSALGAVARDYEAHRRHAGLVNDGGDPHTPGPAGDDDHLARCIMAAFAGRWCAHAVGLLGFHVRDDIRASLRRLTSVDAPRGRQRPVRALQLPEETREEAWIPRAKPKPG